MNMRSSIDSPESKEVAPGPPAGADLQPGDVKPAFGGTTERRAAYETKRGLSPRHVQLMTLGGSIGTGRAFRLQFFLLFMF